MKYRKKPVEIEARQWEGGAAAATPIINWILENGGTARWHDAVGQAPDQISIDTLEGTMYANPGDWILQGVEHEFYPCKMSIFEKTYSRADAVRFDHAAEAREALGLAAEHPADASVHVDPWLLAAQTHATLALVEQQRIANLIALVALSGNENVQESNYDEGSTLSSAGMHALIEYVRTPGTPISDPDDVPMVRSEIRGALGL